MRYGPHHHVAGEKRNGTIGVPASIIHVVLEPSSNVSV